MSQTIEDQPSLATQSPATIDELLERGRRFLEERVRPRTREARAWGVGADDVVAKQSREKEKLDHEVARRFRAELFDAGLAWIDGPVEYGGQGLRPEDAERFTELLLEYELPPTGSLLTTLRIVAPAVAEHGSKQLKDEVLVRLQRCDLIGCQLFSEPEAGSDLANVRTRAVRDGDHWVITGQKVWTSTGHLSDVGLLLARTDPDAPKHAGLSMFLIDMDAPGVTIRPLRQMTGSAHFNEVFLDGVVVPDSRRVGAEGDGWRITTATLGGERKAVGQSQEAPPAQVVERLVELLHHLPPADPAVDAAVRQQVARAHSIAQVLIWTTERFVHASGGHPGPEMSVLKLLRNQVLHEAMSAAAKILGPRMAADTSEWGTYAWTRALLSTPGLRIAGGTDEIQRNILAERVLGLPREPKPNPPQKGET